MYLLPNIALSATATLVVVTPLLSSLGSLMLCHASQFWLSGTRTSGQDEAELAGNGLSGSFFVVQTSVPGFKLARFIAAGERFSGPVPTSSRFKLTPGLDATRCIVHALCRQIGKPDATHTFNELPWSPRWAPTLMASRILSFLQSAVPALLGVGVGAAAPVSPGPNSTVAGVTF